MNQFVRFACSRALMMVFMVRSSCRVIAFLNLNIEAYPTVPPLVQVITQSRPVRRGDGALRHHPHRGADGGIRT